MIMATRPRVLNQIIITTTTRVSLFTPDSLLRHTRYWCSVRFQSTTTQIQQYAKYGCSSMTYTMSRSSQPTKSHQKYRHGILSRWDIRHARIVQPITHPAARYRCAARPYRWLVAETVLLLCFFFFFRGRVWVPSSTAEGTVSLTVVQYSIL